MSLKMKGFDKLVDTLKNQPRKVGAPAVRKAIRAGTAVIRSAVKAATPVDEGKLKKAQDSKIVSRGLSATGIVGANAAKLDADHAADRDRPTNIDDLVEFGHVAPDGTFVPPAGYMRRAAASSVPIAEAKAVAVLKDAIDKIGGK